ncbi:MAG: 50S ribosomal protein L11 methyltransferase [Myxococcota bacterium]
MSSALKLSPSVWVYDAKTESPALRPGQLAIAHTPGAAFGDGRHPTTRLCAGAVDLWVRSRQPKRVLDVGTGTGILARIAWHRGVRHIVATDIDPVALASAEAHFRLDGASGITLSDESPDHWGAVFDLVVANILLAPLCQLASALAASLDANGTLMVSGLLRSQAPALRVELQAQGLRFGSEAFLDDWVLLVFSKG